ncbi:MAG: ABC transporter, partial [Hyphomicrobiaceae bacterium]|nr:ABC transporter [Hyphomicrobiaceae bacterium]
RKAEEESAAAEAVKPWGLAGPIGGKADNLTRIKGIGSKINQIHNEMGIYHFSQIAAWTEKEIEEVDEKLKFRGRIIREKWVEQARILAEGGETEFSRRVDEGEVPTSHTHETPPPDGDGKTS